MTPTELKRLGERLYGYGWQTRLAEALGVNGSTVRRWVSGAVKIRPATVIAIRALGNGKAGKSA